eukprot:SAG31_NODE_242_length_19350_cov_3.043998_11_plen_54_part_00
MTNYFAQTLVGLLLDMIVVATVGSSCLQNQKQEGPRHSTRLRRLPTLYVPSEL